MSPVRLHFRARKASRDADEELNWVADPHYLQDWEDMAAPWERLSRKPLGVCLFVFSYIMRVTNLIFGSCPCYPGKPGMTKPQHAAPKPQTRMPPPSSSLPAPAPAPVQVQRKNKPKKPTTTNASVQNAQFKANAKAAAKASKKKRNSNASGSGNASGAQFLPLSCWQCRLSVFPLNIPL